MKIVVDPMPALRLAASSKVNKWFDDQTRSHRDAAHSMKRNAAKAGAPYPDWFAREAGLRAITSQALADIILSKPDVVAERELRRQRIMATIETAKTPAELDDITANISVA